MKRTLVGAIWLCMTFVGSIFTLIVGNPCLASPVEVTDDLGRQILLARAPTRIISLEPSVTEVLYAVGAQDKVVADDDYSDYPDEAKLKPHVNGIGPSRELILGLRPDLIILYDQTFTRAKADQWQAEYGTPVYVLNAGTYLGIEGDIAKLGALAGNKASTAKILSSMNETMRLVRSKVAHAPAVKAFAVVWDRPLMTAGRGSYIDNLITLAGGVDVASKTAIGYPTYSPERLVSDAPDVILTGTLGYIVIRQVDPALSNLNLAANKLGHSYAIPDDWTSRPGPRLALGLIAIAHVLHPEIFKSSR